MRLIALLSVVAGIHHCATASVGPTAIQHGGDAGAVCLLAAFQNGCRRADYTLSSFGVDTIHSETFVVSHRTAGCTVVVTESFRVVPRPAHTTATATCKRVHRLDGDIVADRCTPAQTISLTKLR